VESWRWACAKRALASAAHERTNSLMASKARSSCALVVGLILVPVSLTPFGCALGAQGASGDNAVSPAESASIAAAAPSTSSSGAVGSTEQPIINSNTTYHHGGNLWSQDYEIVQGGDCSLRQQRTTVTSTNSGAGSCWVVDWNSSTPTDCRVRVHIHDDGGFGYGDCTTIVREEPIGHAAYFANSFEGDPSTAGSNASRWSFAGHAGIDVNAGFAMPGYQNDGWANNYASGVWNAVNTLIPTTPGQHCDGIVWMRTSQPFTGVGYIGVNNQANTTSLTASRSTPPTLKKSSSQDFGAWERTPGFRSTISTSLADLKFATRVATNGPRDRTSISPEPALPMEMCSFGITESPTTPTAGSSAEGGSTAEFCERRPTPSPASTPRSISADSLRALPRSDLASSA
jgi:hypothetical protein